MTVASLTARQREAARTQSVFRDVNELIKQLGAPWLAGQILEHFVCECANTHCTQQFAISHGDYEELRSHPARFAVAPGDDHVLADCEQVLVKREAYWVVEKIEQGRELAETLDPRSRTTRREARE